jgi:hypothetical protein
VQAAIAAETKRLNAESLIPFVQRLNGAANTAAQADGATRESVLAAISAEAEAE